MPRKRARDEAELDSSVLSVEQPRDDPVINGLRNMWQFASLMQYLQFFGSAVKVDDDLDIEVSNVASLCPLTKQYWGRDVQ